MIGDMFKVAVESVRSGQPIPLDFYIVHYDLLSPLERGLRLSRRERERLSADGGRATAESITIETLEETVGFVNGVYEPHTDYRLKFYLRNSYWVAKKEDGAVIEQSHISSENNTAIDGFIAQVLPVYQDTSVFGTYYGQGGYIIQHETVLNPGVRYVAAHEMFHGLSRADHHWVIKKCLMDAGPVDELSRAEFIPKRQGRLCAEHKGVLESIVSSAAK